MSAIIRTLDFPESLDRPVQQQRGGLSGPSQLFGHFRVGQTFYFYEQDRAAIILRQLVQFLDQCLQFFFLRQQPAGSDAADWFRPMRVSLSTKSHQIGASLLPALEPGGVGDHVIGDPRQPSEKSARFLISKLLEVAESFEKCLLQHVLYVCQPPQLKAKLIVNQQCESLLIFLEQGRKRGLVSLLYSGDQVISGCGLFHICKSA